MNAKRNINLSNILVSDFNCIKAGSQLFLPYIKFDMLGDLDFLILEKDTDRAIKFLTLLGFRIASMYDDGYDGESAKDFFGGKIPDKSVDLLICIDENNIYNSIHLIVFKNKLVQWSLNQLVNYKSKRGKTKDIAQIREFESNKRSGIIIQYI